MPFNSMAKRDRKRAGGAGVKRGYHDGKLARPQGHIRRGRNGAAAYAYDDGYIVAQYGRYGRCCKAARRRGHDRRIQNAEAVALDKPYAGRNNGCHILLFDGAYNAPCRCAGGIHCRFRGVFPDNYERTVLRLHRHDHKRRAARLRKHKGEHAFKRYGEPCEHSVQLSAY